MKKAHFDFVLHGRNIGFTPRDDKAFFHLRDKFQNKFKLQKNSQELICSFENFTKF
jgi:hypothetical protein